jgi:hypothetical protein
MTLEQLYIVAHSSWEYHDDHSKKPDSGFFYAGPRYLLVLVRTSRLGHRKCSTVATAPPDFLGQSRAMLTAIVLAAFSKGRSVLKRFPEPTTCRSGRIEVARRSRLGNAHDGEKTAA